MATKANLSKPLRLAHVFEQIGFSLVLVCGFITFPRATHPYGAMGSEQNGRSFVFRNDCAKLATLCKPSRFAHVFGEISILISCGVWKFDFPPMCVTKVFINYKSYILSDECQNVQPRRSNFIKPV